MLDAGTDDLAQVLYLQEPDSYAPVSINDINQGGLGDCFLLAAIGELTLDRPAAITNMISANADGTETVTLYEKSDGSFVPTQINVDNTFPDNSVNCYGQGVFDGQQEIWAQVLEKALATLSGGYDVIDQGGWPMFVMEELTGQAAEGISPASLSVQNLLGYMAAGDLIAFDTPASDSLAYDLVGDHAYMFESLITVDGQAMIQLGNPWGNTEPQLIPLSQVSNSFDEIDVGLDSSTPTAPVAPIEIGISVPSEDGASGGTANVSTPTIAGIAQDGSTVVLSGAGGVLASAVADQYGAWSVALPVLPRGTYGITATATNTYGERSASSDAFALTIDTAVPDAPTDLTLAASTDSGLIGDNITSNDHPTINGRGAAGDAISLYDFGTVLLGKAAVSTDGTWSVTPAQALPDGSYSLSAIQSGAGNTSSASTALDLTVDTTPPAAPADLLLMAGGTDTDETTPIVTGTGEAGAAVALFDGTSRVGSAMVGADAAWSVATTALALGGHSLTATETDAAANVSRASAALMIDILPPAPPMSVTLGGGAQRYDATADQNVQAGSGSDTVTAFAGQATVTGSSGQLTFVGGAAASAVNGGAGSAVVFGGAGGGSYVGGAAGHNVLVAQGAAGVLTQLTGAGADDRLFGSVSGDDVLTAGSGRESILGGGGDTTIGGGTASVVFTGTGPTTVYGGSGGQDTVVGGSGSLAVTAQQGDAIFGSAGTLAVMASLHGADSVVGGSGTLDVVGRGGNMLVVAGTGTSKVHTGDGASLVFAGSGNLSLVGGAGSMQVVAGSGTATINEGAGATNLQVVDGAAGGIVVIEGFRPGIDHVELFGYQASQQSVAIIGGSTVISLADGTKVTLMGVDDDGHGVIG